MLERKAAINIGRRYLRGLVPKRYRPVWAAFVSQTEVSSPAISHRERVLGLNQTQSIDVTARLTVLDAEKAPSSRIELGHGVYLGRNVELTVAGGSVLQIDDDTSIQDGTIIFGQVRVGAHCLFGKYCFVASRGHRFRDRPEWLLRDQDELILSRLASPEELLHAKVWIEDDCWIAQSVVISPGVYVGRGAIIGANTVVTSNIGPYEVHGAAPNRKIGTRLIFEPPLSINAQDDASIPYFYRGFRLRRNALEESRKHGVIEARSHACIVLAAATNTSLRLAGLRLDGIGDFRLRLRINGVDCGNQTIEPGPFEIVADIPGISSGVSKTATPAPLQRFTYIELTAESTSNPMPRVGIRSAMLVSRK